MEATAVTLNDLEGHSQVAGFFKRNPSIICSAFYTISTVNVLARFLCVSGVSCRCKRFIIAPPINLLQTISFTLKLTGRFLDEIGLKY